MDFERSLMKLDQSGKAPYKLGTVVAAKNSEVNSVMLALSYWIAAVPTVWMLPGLLLRSTQEVPAPAISFCTWASTGMGFRYCGQGEVL